MGLGSWGSGTYALGVQSADKELLEVGLIIRILVLIVLIILVIVLGGLGLALGLLAVELGIVHVLVRVLLGVLEGLNQLSSTLLLLGVAGATVGLLFLIILVVLGGVEESLQVFLVKLVLLVVIKAVNPVLDDAEGRAGDGGDVAIGVGLGLLEGVDGSHGDAELERC